MFSAVATAEDEEEAEQVEQESDLEPGLCQDQCPRINDLPGGRGFGEGRVTAGLRQIVIARRSNSSN
jgi:hypothetical protein